MLSVIGITGSGNKITGIYGTKSTMAYKINKIIGITGSGEELHITNRVRDVTP
jgi:hypothetical protein